MTAKVARSTSVVLAMAVSTAAGYGFCQALYQLLIFILSR